MNPLKTTAVWYCPDAETDTDCQERSLSFGNQLLPKSVDTYICPSVTTAVWYCPDAETDTERQFFAPGIPSTSVTGAQLFP
jgi:hypothetical protein